jgi:hypothetical protein
LEFNSSIQPFVHPFNPFEAFKETFKARNFSNPQIIESLIFLSRNSRNLLAFRIFLETTILFLFGKLSVSNQQQVE